MGKVVQSAFLFNLKEMNIYVFVARIMAKFLKNIKRGFVLFNDIWSQ